MYHVYFFDVMTKYEQIQIMIMILPPGNIEVENDGI